MLSLEKTLTSNKKSRQKLGMSLCYICAFDVSMYTLHRDLILLFRVQYFIVDSVCMCVHIQTWPEVQHCNLLITRNVCETTPDSKMCILTKSTGIIYWFWPTSIPSLKITGQSVHKLLIRKCFQLYCHCHLDLWPRNPKYNRGHLLIMTNL